MEKENKLGTMPISKLIINMSLPIIASMLVQALYNIVDSVFVSRVCEQALTAVSLALSLIHISWAASSGSARSCCGNAASAILPHLNRASRGFRPCEPPERSIAS